MRRVIEDVPMIATSASERKRKMPNEATRQQSTLIKEKIFSLQMCQLSAAASKEEKSQRVHEIV
jgi:hypothetical protein